VSDDKLAIFTICSNNYMPMARLLLATARAHCPQADLFICLADHTIAWDGLYDEGCASIVPLEDLPILDLPGFTFRYDVMELNTAAKPFMFLHLMEDRGYTRVLYFDPDIEIHAPLDAILRPLEEGASLALTPHLLQPLEAEDEPNDLSIMRSGVFNLGFLGASNNSETLDILHWWARRLTYECINDQPSGLFVDQKFIDLAPGFLDRIAILRDPGLNVAYWNMTQRALDHDGESYRVDGERPLVFFHFSGFDPRKPDRLSKHTHRFNRNMDEALARITGDYAARLLSNGFGTIPRATYAYGHFASGTPIPDVVRRMFRESYPAWPGNPFETFESHLHQPWTGADMLSTAGVITNFIAYLHRTSAYLGACMDIGSEHGQNLLIDWFLKHAARELGLDERIIYPVSQRKGAAVSPSGRHLTPAPSDVDISVIGYLSTSSGVGEVGRANLRALAEAGVRADGFDVSLGVVSDRSDNSVSQYLSNAPRGRARFFNINADQLPLVRAHMGKLLEVPAYTIANPAWELADFPEPWLAAFDDVDEIWAQSRFIQLMLARKLNKPVIHIPVPLQAPEPAPLRRRDFALPDHRFLFFFAFDFLSFVERKNPLGAIAAFRRAFPRTSCGNRDTHSPALVIKTINGAHAPAALRNLCDEIEEDPDIFLMNRVLPRAEIAALIARCDAVLSLHRAEGFGLLVAEAMLLDRPVIATDYASTTEMVTPATGFPVDFRLVPVPAGAYPFADGQVWADPDLDHAAWLMARLAADPASAAATTKAARVHIERNYNPARVAGLQLKRLRELNLIR
jgi:glycosyltransferase involved in cell wall biosynthesis